MKSCNKLQSLLITHLEKYGNVKFNLPNNMTLEIGINQLDKTGNLVKTDNYCWIMASKNDRMALMDSYNLGLKFEDKDEFIVFDDKSTDSEGKKIRTLELI